MGRLRIIGGVRKGLPLFSLRGSSLRPTSGRVRESLFDIIGKEVAGARFLDLFAGTGAVGIEALSRGAASCLFVEKDRAAAAIVRRNLLTGGFGPRGGVIVGSLPAALSRLPPGERFDLVFVDPPYEGPQGEETLRALGRSGSLAPACRVILEHRKSWEPPARSGCLCLRRSARYGDTVLSFFVKDDGDTAEGITRMV
jgi:16S rRNA (guanine966-N2)-methyltransferase